MPNVYNTFAKGRSDLYAEMRNNCILRLLLIFNIFPPCNSFINRTARNVEKWIAQLQFILHSSCLYNIDVDIMQRHCTRGSTFLHSLCIIGSRYTYAAVKRKLWMHVVSSRYDDNAANIYKRAHMRARLLYGDQIRSRLKLASIELIASVLHPFPGRLIAPGRTCGKLVSRR